MKYLLLIIGFLFVAGCSQAVIVRDCVEFGEGSGFFECEKL